MNEPISLTNIRRLYDRFNASVTEVDCGKKCAPHNPSGKPFCCDICHAVPAAYAQEWDYLRQNTDLWHAYRGDECAGETSNLAELQAETPPSMRLLACKGPALCQRNFRALSCRQFPFFPYVSYDFRFLGLAYEWEFESTCWVISNLGQVTEAYRGEFIQTFDALFAEMPDELQAYAIHSDQMREVFANQHRRIPLLHRNGGFYLISPNSERLQRVPPEVFRRHGPYQDE